MKKLTQYSSLVDEDEIISNKNLAELISPLSYQDRRQVQEMFIDLQAKLNKVTYNNELLREQIGSYENLEDEGKLLTINTELKAAIEKIIYDAEELKVSYKKLASK